MIDGIGAVQSGDIAKWSASSADQKLGTIKVYLMAALEEDAPTGAKLRLYAMEISDCVDRRIAAMPGAKTVRLGDMVAVCYGHLMQ